MTLVDLDRKLQEIRLRPCWESRRMVRLAFVAEDIEKVFGVVGEVTVGELV